MKTIILAFVAMLLSGTHAAAAIKIDQHQARNMDEVMSLGVIYINHNFATEQEAEEAINDDAERHAARYYRSILMREPGSNGNMHVSAELYR